MIDPKNCHRELERLKLDKDLGNIYKCGIREEDKCKPTDGGKEKVGAYVIYGDDNMRLRFCEEGYVRDWSDRRFLHCLGRVMTINSMPYSYIKADREPQEKDAEREGRRRESETDEDAKRRENLNEMLACALAQAFDGDYDTAEMFIAKADEYYQSISTERARKCSLITTGIVAAILSAVLAMMMLHHGGARCIPHYQWMFGIYMGAMGAGVSIWQRYGKTEFTGYASQCFYMCEVGARIAVGMTFSIVAIAAIKEGWISSNMLGAGSMTTLGMMLTGFISGFSERLVPAMAEHLAGAMEKQADRQPSVVVIDKRGTATNSGDDEKKQNNNNGKE